MEAIIKKIKTGREIEFDIDSLTDEETVCDELGLDYEDSVEGEHWCVDRLLDCPTPIEVHGKITLASVGVLDDLLLDHEPDLIALALDQIGGASYNLDCVDRVEDWINDQGRGFYSTEASFAEEYLEETSEEYNNLSDEFKRCFDLNIWFNDSGFCSEQLTDGLFIFSNN